MPLLFRLTVAPAFSFVFVLSARSLEYETEKMKRNNRQNDVLIFFWVKRKVLFLNKSDPGLFKRSNKDNYNN